jgi:hypothetical protein
MDLFGLGIQNAGEFHFLSLETVHQIRPIEPEDILARKQNQVASHMLNAVNRAGIGGPTHGFGFEHLLMRPRQGVNIHRALAVGNFAVENPRTLAVGGGPAHPGTTALCRRRKPALFQKYNKTKLHSKPLLGLSFGGSKSGTSLR